MTDEAKLWVLGLLALIRYVLGLLIQAGTAGAETVPVASLPDLPDWEEPDVFRQQPAVQEASVEAIQAAREGNYGNAFTALSEVAGATGHMEARWLNNAVRTAWYFDPRVAQAVVKAAGEVLEIA